jgi:hypothetical protein
MLLKVGVSLRGLHPLMRVVLKYVERWHLENGFDDGCIVTETLGGEHGPGSWHYVGLAVDFRTRHLSTTQLAALRSYLTAKLPGFDLVFHPTHLHTEPGDALARKLGLMP